MLVALRAIRSFVSMLLVGTYFTLGSIVLRLAVLPAVWIWPRLRFPLTSVYMRTMARGIFALLTLGERGSGGVVSCPPRRPSPSSPTTRR